MPQITMPPELHFVDNFHKKSGELGPFTYLERSNIVQHCTVRPTAATHSNRAALYRMCAPVGLATNATLSKANLESTKGLRSHYRIRTDKDGKFLIFGTGNIILAGRKSHAAACLSATRMIRLLAHSQQTIVSPVTHSSPNSVITGQLKEMVSEDVKNSLFVNHSSKFPGIALNIETPGVTPELYLRRGMVIIPGVTSSAALTSAIQEIGILLKPYQHPSSPLGLKRKDRSPDP
jgi:TATA-box binding protein (TBP) (component of TFIID and TFIIIB)